MQAQDITLLGANNSSVTVKTDLVDLKINASSLGVDFGGNYTLTGNDIFQAAVDIGGVFDPTPTLDILGASMSAKSGDYWGAGASVLGAALPYVGDLAKTGKIAKGIDKISDAIGAAKGESKSARFISDTDGKIIDTHTTPKGSYTHADGSRTDVLQDKSHYNKTTQENHGTTHTHEPYSNTDPKTGKTFTGASNTATHPSTYKEVKDIKSGVSKPN